MSWARRFSETSKAYTYLVAYSSIPPLIGVIAAAVIYVVFAGRMISGDLFPAFDCSRPNECTTLPGVLNYWSPVSATDYAKAVVWGFISGFSERFFVDILNQFGSKGSDK